MARKRLGEILVQAGVIDESQLRAALAEQRRWGGPLGRILVDMKMVTEDSMVQALSHQLNFPAVNLDNRNIDNAVLDMVPGELAEQHSFVPFHMQGKFVDVAMTDPTNLGIIDELRIRTRMNVRPYLAGPKMIERALARFYGRGAATLYSGGAVVATPAMEAAMAESAQPSQSRILEVATDQGFRPASYGRGAAAPPATGGPPATVGVAEAAALAPGATPAGVRRQQAYEFEHGGAREAEQAQEISSLQGRVQHLEALIARDEEVLRRVLGLLIEKGLATRDEILERIK